MSKYQVRYFYDTGLENNKVQIRVDHKNNAQVYWNSNLVSFENNNGPFGDTFTFESAEKGTVSYVTVFVPPVEIKDRSYANYTTSIAVVSNRPGLTAESMETFGQVINYQSFRLVGHFEFEVL